MSCDCEVQVHRYHDGQLPGAERAGVEAHLRECPGCAQLLADLQRLSINVRGAELVTMPQITLARMQKSFRAVRDRGVVRIAEWLTAAAAAILIGGLLAWPSERAEASADMGWENSAVNPPEIRDDSN